MEMRKLDRDREKTIHPSTLEYLLEKYKIPLGPFLASINSTFEHSDYPGLTDYEKLVR